MFSSLWLSLSKWRAPKEVWTGVFWEIKSINHCSLCWLRRVTWWMYFLFYPHFGLLWFPLPPSCPLDPLLFPLHSLPQCSLLHLLAKLNPLLINLYLSFISLSHKKVRNQRKLLALPALKMEQGTNPRGQFSLWEMPRGNGDLDTVCVLFSSDLYDWKDHMRDFQEKIQMILI
jgi:hypothetical protein